MAVQLTDNWAMPAPGAAAPAMPEAKPAPSSGGLGMSADQWANLALATPILLDRSSSPTQKVQALLALNRQQEQLKQEAMLKSYGADLARIMDETGGDSKALTERVNDLVATYTSKGVNPNAMMQTTANFMNYVNSRKQSAAADADAKYKAEARLREERTREAMKSLTGSLPRAENYQAGSFKALGIGSPTGKPSEAPSQAAPGEYPKALQQWIEKVRRNPDIPVGKKELVIKELTGQDPETQRKLLLKDILGGGKGSERKFSDMKNEMQYNAMRRIAAGQGTEADYLIAGIPFDKGSGIAARAVLSNPTVWGKSPEEIQRMIAKGANIIRKQALESQGIPSIQDGRNLQRYMGILKQ